MTNTLTNTLMTMMQWSLITKHEKTYINMHSITHYDLYEDESRSP
jgi:hypothetical protein